MGGGWPICFYLIDLFFLFVQALIPLCENMPSGRANKPGDVVTAMNGKTIQVGSLNSFVVEN